MSRRRKPSLVLPQMVSDLQAILEQSSSSRAIVRGQASRQTVTYRLAVSAKPRKLALHHLIESALLHMAVEKAYRHYYGSMYR